MYPDAESSGDVKPAIREAVRAFLLREVLSGEDAAELEDSTSLIDGRILNSISIVKLVSFLSDTYGIEFEAHELSADYLDTIPAIADVVTFKRGS